MITIIDYGMGNLGSIVNMFRKLGVESEISSDKNQIKASGKLLLPGVGAFDAAMDRINRMELRSLLDEKVFEGQTPILGICLGMQLLTNASEEGKLPGLGYIPAKTIKFSEEAGLKVPHMGWNEVRLVDKSLITNGLNSVSSFEEKARFYFVHSYKVKVESEENSILKSIYGTQEFDSGIKKDNIYGVQFHPEKSHKFGMQLLKNFADI